jgi:hypothetical protein
MTLRMSADWARPEVSGGGQSDAIDPDRAFDRFRFWAGSEVSAPVLTLGKVDLQFYRNRLEIRFSNRRPRVTI